MTESRPDANLAALIGSRLCHDLVSPLGAIGNGLELLQMTQAPTPEMDLVGEAVKVAQARLRLFRLAFGVARDDMQVTPTDLSEALDALTANGRITLAASLPGPVPRPLARRLTLAALCAESALAWGGDIALNAAGLSATAKRLKLDPDLWGPLAMGAPPVMPSSRDVQFTLLAQSGAVQVQTTDESVTITL